LQRHRPSNFRLDDAATARGRRTRKPVRISASRPRQYFRRPPRRVDSKARNQGIEIAASLPDGQCDLRTGRRHDSTRVLGLVDTPVRITFAIHSEIVEFTLQHWASAHGPGPRSSWSAAHYPRPPTTPFAPSARSIVRRRCPSDPWRPTSRVLSRSRRCVIEYLRTTRASSEPAAGALFGRSACCRGFYGFEGLWRW
jgi:hypothetical protein